MGFLTGSLLLIIMEVLLQPGSASKVKTGSGALANGLHRLISGDVAAIPSRAKAGAKPASATTTPTSPGLAPGSVIKST